MRKLAGVLTIAAIAMIGCSDDDGGDGSDLQGELATLLQQDVDFGVDKDCLTEKTEELTDQQAEFLIENFDAESADGFDAEIQAWVASLVDCVDDGLTDEDE